MDALPVKEATGLTFCSQVEGMHHACVFKISILNTRVMMAIVQCFSELLFTS
jgi:metal-dependent amidase/aminoacylase/carboxypeptidase family protein